MFFNKDTKPTLEESIFHYFLIITRRQQYNNYDKITTVATHLYLIYDNKVAKYFA